MFPHRTPMCAYNRSIDRTRSCFCFFLNRIIIINNINHDNNVHCNRFNTNVETNLMMTKRTEALVCKSVLNGCYASNNVHVFTWVCVCMQVCVFIWMSHALRVCVCVRLLAGGSKQNKPNKTKTKKQNKRQNGIIIADILKNKQRHKLYRDSILFW